MDNLAYEKIHEAISYRIRESKKMGNENGERESRQEMTLFRLGEESGRQRIAIFTGSDLRHYGGGEKDAIATANALKQHADVTIFSLQEGIRRRRVNMRVITRQLKGVTVEYYHGKRLILMKDILPYTNFDLSDFSVIYSYAGGFLLNRKIERTARRLVLGMHTMNSLSRTPSENRTWKRLLFPIVNCPHVKLVKRAKEVRVQNLTDIERLHSLGWKGRLWNIPPITSDDCLAPTGNGEFIALWVNRISPEKQPDHIGKILKFLDPSVRVVVVGSGDTSLLGDIGKKENVSIMGFVTDSELDRLMAEAACYFSTSRGENFGMSAVEAMKHGLPTVVYDVMGLRDYNRFVVHSPGEMATRINWLHDEWKRDRSSYMQMRSLVAKEAMERFSAEKVIPAMLQMFGIEKEEVALVSPG